MNELSVKQASFNENPAGTTPGLEKQSKAGGLAGAFRNLVSKASVNFSADATSVKELSALQGGIGTLTATRQTEPSYRETDRPDENPADRERPVTERRDNPDKNAVDQYSDQKTGNDTDTITVGNTSETDNLSNQNNDRFENQNSNADNSSRQETAKSNTEKSGDEVSASDQNKDDTANPSADRKTSAANTQNGTLVAAQQILGTTNVAGLNQASGKPQQQTGPVGKTDGRADGDGVQSGDNRSEKTLAPGQVVKANNAQDGKSGASQKAAQTQTNNSANTANNQAGANPQGVEKQGLDGVKTATRQQQAQEISQKLGQGQRAEVNVEISKDSEKLVSRPANTLNSAAAATAEAKNKVQANGVQNNPNQGQTQQQPQNAVAQNVNAGQQGTQQSAGARFQAITGTGAVNSNGTSASAITEGGAANSNTAAPGQATNTLQTAATQSAKAAPQAQARAPLPGHSVVDQVNVKISKALQAGVDKIKIQLRPAELGRIEVKLELTHDGRAAAVVTADNKDTLDLLRRDASELQRALNDSGMNLDQNDLEFNLKGQENQTAHNDGAGNGQASAALDDDDSDGAAEISGEPGVTHIIEDDRVDVSA